jgi:glycosyltransferase involved in cell wall biosynthesis
MGKVPLVSLPLEQLEMRVLILNYEYPPLGGGAGVATAALANGLASRGVNVDVVTSGCSGGKSALPGSAELEEQGRLRIYRVPSRRVGVHEAGMLGAASYLLHAFPLVRRLVRTMEYDAVHVFFSLPTGALLPFAAPRRTPVVLSLRGSDVPGYDPYNRSMQQMHRLLAPLTRWIWRRASRVVAVCDSLGQLAQRTLPTLGYTVIPNGVDLELFHPAPGAGARQTGGNGPIRCLAVARLVERKGLGELIRAFALLPRGHFALEIVGDGPDREKLGRLAASLGVASEIRFTGSLDRKAVAERYRAADLFTLPSSAEAFGNVFAEALASGLPVVGSTVGGIPELVEHGVNGLLIDPGQPLALARAIQYLAQDPELRQLMSVRNRAKAEADLEWSQATTRYLAVYEALGHRMHAPAVLRTARATAVSTV